MYLFRRFVDISHSLNHKKMSIINWISSRKFLNKSKCFSLFFCIFSFKLFFPLLFFLFFLLIISHFHLYLFSRIILVFRLSKKESYLYFNRVCCLTFFSGSFLFRCSFCFRISHVQFVFFCACDSKNFLFEFSISSSISTLIGFYLVFWCFECACQS